MRVPENLCIWTHGNEQLATSWESTSQYASCAPEKQFLYVSVWHLSSLHLLSWLCNLALFLLHSCLPLWQYSACYGYPKPSCKQQIEHVLWLLLPSNSQHQCLSPPGNGLEQQEVCSHHWGRLVWTIHTFLKGIAITVHLLHQGMNQFHQKYRPQSHESKTWSWAMGLVSNARWYIPSSCYPKRTSTLQYLQVTIIKWDHETFFNIVNKIEYCK